ncbi:18877_t:CDS:2, partial [Acaulospora morrowiae]
MPPGFGSVNNNSSTSSSTSSGEYNSRTFSHASDNVPVAVGYGRSNSLSVIPQGSNIEEGLTFQQTQQSLYGPSFGHSFLPTTPPRASKSNPGFGGAYENTYLEATIKSSLSALAENDDQDWEKVIRNPGLEDSPKESIVYKPTRSATLPSQSEINNSAYSAWAPSTSSFASQNLTNLPSAQTPHALNNNNGYFPPQLQQANDQFSGYNGGMFSHNIRRTSTANNVQGNGIIHDEPSHARFDHGLGGPLDYYDPTTPAGAVTPSSPTSLQRRRTDENGDDAADDVVTGSMALYDP